MQGRVFSSVDILLTTPLLKGPEAMSAPSDWVNPAMAAFQEQRQMTQTSAYRAAQEIYWKERASVKRSAPSPAISSLATPQEQGPHESTGPTLVQPWSLQDHTAAQVVAATHGVQPQDETFTLTRRRRFPGPPGPPKPNTWTRWYPGTGLFLRLFITNWLSQRWILKSLDWCGNQT